jgi:hypothetical protein
MTRRGREESSYPATRREMCHNWTRGDRKSDMTHGVFLHAADACVLPFDNGVRMKNSSFSAAAGHGLVVDRFLAPFDG